MDAMPALRFGMAPGLLRTGGTPMLPNLLGLSFVIFVPFVVRLFRRASIAVTALERRKRCAGCRQRGDCRLFSQITSQERASHRLRFPH
jgi:hypothetical protein